MKRFLTVLVALSLLLTCTIPTNIVFAEDTFVEVGSPEEFTTQVNLGADIRLTDDIKLGNWTPVPYSGKLDGNKHTIDLQVSGITTSTSSGAGLFSVYSGSEIKDLTITGSISASGGRIGAIAGIVTSQVATIRNCVNKASVSDTGSWTNFAAGLIGTTDPAGGYGGWGDVTVAVINCRNEGDISGRVWVAGLVGVLNARSSIINSSNIGSVSGYGNVAGLAGRNFGRIQKSYNIGSVATTVNNGNYYIGGLVTEMAYGELTSCYNAGLISIQPLHANTNGGLIGMITPSGSERTMTGCYNIVTNGINPVVSQESELLTISNTYYLGDINHEDNVANTEPKTIEELKDLSETLGEDFEDSSEEGYVFPQISENINDLSGVCVINTTAEEGTVTPEVAYVKSGKSASFNFEAKDGTTLQKIMVNGVDNAGTLKDKTSGIYTASSVSENTEIEFIFGDGYTKITTPEQFMNMDPAGSYKLMNDITLDNYEPIESFSGKLIGANPETTINVAIDDKTGKPTGLFRTLSGQVANIKVAGSISGSAGYVGGIAGKASGTTTEITNCVNEAIITGKGSMVAGIVGGPNNAWTDKIVITACKNNGNVTGDGVDYVAGIIGQLSTLSSVVSACSNNGDIKGGSYVGGMVGRAYNSTIEKSYNMGRITGTGYYLAGILGYGVIATPKIVSCYNAGEVIGTDNNRGGIIGGAAVATTIDNCYSVNYGSFAPIAPAAINQEIVKIGNCYYLSDDAKDDSLSGTEAKTFSEMKALATLGNDFEITEGAYVYPQLKENENDLEKVLTVSVLKENGTVFPEIVYVTKGNTVTITFKADDGCTLDTITENGNDVTGNLKGALTGSHTTSAVTTDTDVELAFVDGYIKIYDADGFKAIANDTTADYKLMNEITLPADYVPIESFSGQLIGANPETTINVAIDDNTGNPTGLFRTLSAGAYIKNIKVNGSVSGSAGFVGGLAGNISGKGIVIEDCVNNATISGNGAQVAGIIGGTAGAWSDSITITGTKNTADVDAGTNSYVGGIIGQLPYTASSIIECVNTGDISAGAFIGGITGRNYNTISKSYNMGTIKGTSNASGIGGIAGAAVGIANTPSIQSCYNTGRVYSTNSANSNVAGILGQADVATAISNCYSLCIGNEAPIVSNETNKTVSNCYYLSNDAKDDGITGTEPKTLNEMKTLATLGDNFELLSGDYYFPQIKGNTNKLEDMFKIEVSAEEGAVWPVIAFAKEGKSVDISFRANGEYLLKELTANGVDIAGESKSKQEGIHTISDITSDLIVAFTFADAYTHIETEEDFAKIAEDPAGAYKVMNTIELSKDYEPIAEFSGKLIGANPETTIIVNINDESGNPTGLMRTLKGAALIKDIKVTGSVTSTSGFVGGIAGKTFGKEVVIENCVNDAEIIAGGNNAGGIIGGPDNAWTDKVTITGCKNTGNVTAYEKTFVGGIIGQLPIYSIMTTCANTGDILGLNYVGGIAGRTYKDISTSYNRGTIIGEVSVGGIAGATVGSLQIVIDSCYNAGMVNSMIDKSYLGGITGNAESTGYTTIKDCYSLYQGGAAPIMPDETKENLKTAINCYYLSYGNAELDSYEGTTALELAEITANEFVINENFVKTAGFSYPNIAGNLNTEDIAFTTITVENTTPDLGTAIPVGTSYVIAGEEAVLRSNPNKGYTLYEVVLDGEVLETEWVEWAVIIPQGTENVVITFDYATPEIEMYNFNEDIFYGDLLSKIGLSQSKLVKDKEIMLTFARIGEENDRYKKAAFGFALFNSVDDFKDELEPAHIVNLMDENVDSSEIKFGTIIYGDALTADEYFVAPYAEFEERSGKTELVYGPGYTLTLKTLQNNISANE